MRKYYKERFQAQKRIARSMAASMGVNHIRKPFERKERNLKQFSL